ncbi:MAG: alanine racemase [Gammaproteobacteria bacterium]|nr:MAG: alanine racemase [Gammaproteobacteria bacterium]
MSRDVTATINISALQNNFKLAKNLQPQAKMMAVVKSDAYGHGVIPVAKALNETDGFAVSCIDEAQKLRGAGITKKIILLEGVHTADEIDYIASNNMEMVVHSDWQLQVLMAEKRSLNLKVWIKIETGMNRLGLAPKQAISAYGKLKSATAVSSDIGLATHFANADDLNSNHTQQQLHIFADVLCELNDCKRVSLLNSAGIMEWGENEIYKQICYGREVWCRPGIMLYGVSPFSEYTAKLQSVMTLKSRLIAIKDCACGECVSYGSRWQAQRDSRIAVAAIGYGDGYPRHAIDGTPVLVDNKQVPLSGRVTMDMICIDVTDMPEAKVGNEVVLWGKGLPIEEIAASSDTIGYELLCGVTRRVRTIYGKE